MAIYRRCGKCGKKIAHGIKCECLKLTRKDYNKNVRYNNENKEYSIFYNSIHWKRMSSYIRCKYNDLCLMCYFKYKILTIANVVHHIVELKEDYTKRLDEDNLITLCHSCHNILHGNYTDKEKQKLHNIKNMYEDEFL